MDDGNAAGSAAAARQMLTDVLRNGGSPAPGNGGSPGAGSERSSEVVFTGNRALPSVFPVTALASASLAIVGLSLSTLLACGDGVSRRVSVDQRLASMWFSSSLRPLGWQPPPAWDPIAGDYRSCDGWIRLHTNVAAHRRAALAVLGVEGQRDQVAAAVRNWQADDLETAVVGAGGCAAAMRSRQEWQRSEQGQALATEPLIGWDDAGTSGRPLDLPLDPARPLAGVRVLDLTRVLAGPVATRLLAMLGADVLRVDPPGWDEALVPEVMLGKRSCRLDLRRPRAREQFRDLLAEADVLVHGYRPGALESLDLGREVRARARPGLIEVTLDAYGWTGPWADRRGFDSLVQMSTGIAEAGMRPLDREEPTPLPVQALDHATGQLMAHAVLHALSTRLTTGRSSIARLSLARTSRLLTAHVEGRPGAGLSPEDAGLPPEDAGLPSEDERDLAPGIEETGWGPARRLRTPLAVEGASIAARLPSRPLGVDHAAWPRRSSRR